MSKPRPETEGGLVEPSERDQSKARELCLHDYTKQCRAHEFPPYITFACPGCVAQAIAEARAEAFREAKEDCRESHTVETQRLNAVTQLLEAAEARVRELEVSAISHFQREHLEGDGPEIDRWKRRVKALEEALRKAAAGFEELHANMPCPACPVPSDGDACPDLELVRAALAGGTDGR